MGTPAAPERGLSGGRQIPGRRADHTQARGEVGGARLVVALQLPGGERGQGGPEAQTPGWVEEIARDPGLVQP